MQARPPSPNWTIARALWFALGCLGVGLGFVGIIIPVLPTTPFILVAVWAFGKSSPAFAERLRRHKVFGPYVRDWEAHRVIPAKAKIAACVMMSLSLGWLVWFTAAPAWAKMLTAALMAAAAFYVLSKPSRPL